MESPKPNEVFGIDDEPPFPGMRRRTVEDELNAKCEDEESYDIIDEIIKFIKLYHLTFKCDINI